MPLGCQHDERSPVAGDYYVHRATGALVEIMTVSPCGDCMVLDVTAPLDGEWRAVTAAQIASSFWQRLDAGAEAKAA